MSQKTQWLWNGLKGQTPPSCIIFCVSFHRKASLWGSAVAELRRFWLRPAWYAGTCRHVHPLCRTQPHSTHTCMYTCPCACTCLLKQCVYVACSATHIRAHSWLHRYICMHILSYVCIFTYMCPIHPYMFVCCTFIPHIYVHVYYKCTLGFSSMHEYNPAHVCIVRPTHVYIHMCIHTCSLPLCMYISLHLHM